ncbi:MAG: MipA/OmpV family protein [Desulfopila sp.]
MRRKAAIICSALVGGMLLGQSATAADVVSSLGAGIGMGPDYEGSDNYTLVPLLYGQIGWGNGQYVALEGNQLRWNMGNNQIEFGPLLQYRPKRGNVDDNRVDDLQNIDAAAEAGMFITGRSGPWSATAEFAADISDTYNGYLITLIGRYQTQTTDELTTTFKISSTYASGNYMETYFQIDNGNRHGSSLHNYKADRGQLKDIGLAMVNDYRINRNWSIMGNIGYKYLLGDAADSPIVERAGSEGQFYLGAMGVYHF